MSKRGKTDYERRSRDYYPTRDPDAVYPLQHYYGSVRPIFYEPCVGEGHLLDLLNNVGFHHSGASDILDTGWGVEDASTLTGASIPNKTEVFITNPPFKWEILHPIIGNLSNILPTWLLLPADFMHNKRSAPYMNRCGVVLSVGRLYWEENKVKGTDNFCWFCFFRGYNNETRFYPRIV